MNENVKFFNFFSSVKENSSPQADEPLGGSETGRVWVRCSVRPTQHRGVPGLCAREEGLIRRFFAGNDAREVPHLQLNAAQIRCFFVARRMLKSLLHPLSVAGEEPAKCCFGEANAFVSLLKVLGFDTLVVDARKHVAVYDNRSEFLHQIRGERGMSMLGLMKISTVGIEPDDVEKGVDVVVQ